MDNSFLQLLHDWQSFYLLMGTAAATLIGLIFVAVSLGADLVIPDSLTTAHTWVTPIIVQFGVVLMISALINVPTLTSAWLAVLLVFTGSAGIGYTIVIGLQLMRQFRAVGRRPVVLIGYVVIPTASYLLILASAIGLALYKVDLLNGLALAVLILVMISVYSAWQLALWFTGRRHQQ